MPVCLTVRGHFSTSTKVFLQCLLVTSATFQLAFCQTNAQDQFNFNIDPNTGASIQDKTPVPLGDLIKTIADGDTLAKAEALYQLIERKTETQSAIPVLTATLDHRDHSIRALASDAFVAIGKAAVQPLRAALAKSTGRQLAAIATTLGRLEKLTIEDLRSFATNKDPRVKAVAAKYAARFEQPGSTLLIEMLNDPEPAVAVAAIEALANCTTNKPQAVEALKSTLTSDTLAPATIETLAKLGMDAQRAIPNMIATGIDVEDALKHIGPPHPDDLPAMAKLLYHHDQEIQILAAEQLELLGKGVAPIIDDLEKAASQTAERYLLAVKEAEKHADDDYYDDNSGRMTVAIESMANCLLNTDDGIERYLNTCVMVAEKTGFYLTYSYNAKFKKLGQQAVPMIRKLLQHQNEDVRLMALEGVAYMGPAGAAVKDDVAKFLESTDEFTRANAIEALTTMGPSAGSIALPYLVSDYKHGRIELRDFADRIAGIGYASMEAQLILEKGMIEAEDWRKSVCARALIKSTTQLNETSNKIISAANDGVFANTRTVIKAFSETNLKTPEYIDFLISQLDSKDGWTRHDALVALGKLGPYAKSALPSIQQRLNDSQSSTKLKACSAIYLISGEPQQLHKLFEEMLVPTEENERLYGLRVVNEIIELGHAGAEFQDLVVALSSKAKPYVMERVVEACVCINSAETRALLIDLSKSRDWAIHSAATKALENTDNQKQKAHQ